VVIVGVLVGYVMWLLQVCWFDMWCGYYRCAGWVCDVVIVGVLVGYVMWLL